MLDRDADNKEQLMDMFKTVINNSTAQSQAMANALGTQQDTLNQARAEQNQQAHSMAERSVSAMSKVLASKAGAPKNNVENVFCGSCGAKNAAGSERCGSCGEAL